MGLILVVLLLALVFGGLGFVYPILWIVALVLLVGWIFGFSPAVVATRGRHKPDTAGRGPIDEESAWRIGAIRAIEEMT